MDTCVPLVMWVGPPLSYLGDPVVYRLNREAEPWRYDYIAPAALPAVILELKARGVKPLMFTIQCPMCDAEEEVTEALSRGWYQLFSADDRSIWFDKATCIRMWSAEELMRKRAE